MRELLNEKLKPFIPADNPIPKEELIQRVARDSKDPSSSNVRGLINFIKGMPYNIFFRSGNEVRWRNERGALAD